MSIGTDLIEEVQEQKNCAQMSLALPKTIGIISYQAHIQYHRWSIRLAKGHERGRIEERRK